MSPPQLQPSIQQGYPKPKERGTTPLGVSQTQPTTKGNGWKWGLGILVSLCVITGIMRMGAKQSSITQTSTTPASAPSAPPKETSRTINASVSFTGTQFIITNEDKYDWTDVKLELNGGFFSGGYELKHPVIKAGETYTVGALQFADSDGTRFNPYQMKPKRFSICAKTLYGSDCRVVGWD